MPSDILVLDQIDVVSMGIAGITFSNGSLELTVSQNGFRNTSGCMLSNISAGNSCAFEALFTTADSNPGGPDNRWASYKIAVSVGYFALDAFGNRLTTGPTPATEILDPFLTVTATPEPASIGLVGVTLLVMLPLLRRKTVRTN